MSKRLVRERAAPDKFTKLEVSYTVESAYTIKRKSETVEAVPTAVRFVFSVAPNSEIVIENIEAEIGSAK